MLERGIAEIVNDFASDPRSHGSEQMLRSLISAPLRAKQSTIGIVALANTETIPYTTTDLKLLNTIALQTAALPNLNAGVAGARGGCLHA